VHPSGLIILLMALATGLLLKRGFCSGICPFGLLTEYLNFEWLGFAYIFKLRHHAVYPVN
jgi:hypothetical protein